MKKIKKFLLNLTMITSILFTSVNVFAQGQVVKVSIGSTKASVNGNETILNIAPYIQQPSESMMIPLRFVSTGLGIDENAIQFNANTKEITINYNGKSAKFIVGTNKLVLNGEEFSMLIENKYPVYTEIKNGSTFIPLRSLELSFGVKIDWEASTKTAILSNGNIVEQVEEVTEQVTTTPLTEPTETVKTFDEYTEEEIRAMEEEVVRLVNEERVKHSLQPLEISEKLMNTAREKSQDMSNNNYFAHISPKYGKPADILRSKNISFSWFGENIAKKQSTPKEAIEAWMNSKGHRENILNSNAEYIGVGFSFRLDYNDLTYDGNPTIETYWTQQFISN